MADKIEAFSVHVEFGALVRSSAVFEIESAALRAGVTCQKVEQRGFLSSDYQFRFTGEQERIRVFRQALKRWFDQQSDR